MRKDKLEEMFDHQVKFQEKLGTLPFKSMSDRIQFIKDMVLATYSEIDEFLREVPWKPWKKHQEYNQENAKEELVDEFHFFMNRCIAVDLDADELHKRYLKKNEINHKRQADGY